jgi:hypothetical protein
MLWVDHHQQIALADCEQPSTWRTVQSLNSLCHRSVNV